MIAKAHHRLTRAQSQIKLCWISLLCLSSSQGFLYIYIYIYIYIYRSKMAWSTFWEQRNCLYKNPLSQFSFCCSSFLVAPAASVSMRLRELPRNHWREEPANQRPPGESGWRPASGSPEGEAQVQTPAQEARKSNNVAAPHGNERETSLLLVQNLAGGPKKERNVLEKMCS